MVEQATFLVLKLEFENMVMSILIINPDENAPPPPILWTNSSDKLCEMRMKGEGGPKIKNYTVVI